MRILPKRTNYACSATEFRRRAVELAREQAEPIVRIGEYLGCSESSLRRWMAHGRKKEEEKADVDDGAKPR